MEESFLNLLTFTSPVTIITSMHSKATLVTACTLFLGSLVSAGMALIRSHTSGSHYYFFLIWNLFLAWIPFGLSSLIYLSSKHSKKLNFALLSLSFLWLLFFPNALYIITDFIHLEPKNGIPLWFDIVLLFSFAWNGLVLGFLSLYQMQRVMEKLMGKTIGWLFSAGALGLTSLGVYLGRFQRWNSWDLFLEPKHVVKDILRPLVHPYLYRQSLKITLIYAVFFIFMYLTLYAFTHLHKEPKRD